MKDPRHFPVPGVFAVTRTPRPAHGPLRGRDSGRFMKNPRHFPVPGVFAVTRTPRPAEMTIVRTGESLRDPGLVKAER